jgi:hypothetical protein
VKQFYKEIRLQRSSLAMVDKINDIAEDYMRQGYTLTLRQLYYQLVSKNVIVNTERSYKNLGALVNDARLAGLIDWDAIEDRGRAFKRRGNWASGGDILAGCAQSFHMDMWKGQDFRPYLIVEKDALVGVLSRVTYDLDVSLLGARGYPSASVLREFGAYDMRTCRANGQLPVLIHLGDHDPSGLDMSRDLDERIAMFAECEVGDIEFRRIALNMEQIKELNPPPNPAKVTDARFANYQKQYGNDSWELDALEPSYLDRLARSVVEPYIDQDAWEARKAEINAVRARLKKVSDEFDKPPGSTPPVTPERMHGLGGGIDSL